MSEKRIINGGVLRRMTVAVVIDGNRSKEELAQISGLVRSAIGYDERRGDVVTVEAVPFLVVAEPPPPAAPPSLKLPYGLENPKKFGPIAGGVFALLLIMVVLSVRKSSKARAARASLALVAAQEKASAEAVAVEILQGNDDRKDDHSPDALKQMVRERALLDPATAAIIVKGWLGSAEAVIEKAA